MSTLYPVPATAATVTPSCECSDFTAALLHRTRDEELHEAVEQLFALSVAVTV